MLPTQIHWVEEGKKQGERESGEMGGSVGEGEVWKVVHSVDEEAQDEEMKEVADVDLRSWSLKKEEEL